jgi:hypothetical protein
MGSFQPDYFLSTRINRRRPLVDATGYMLCAAVNVDTDVDVRVKEEIIFRVPIQHVEQVIVKQVLVSDKKCKHKGK